MRNFYRKLLVISAASVVLGITSTHGQVKSRGVAVANGGLFMGSTKAQQSTFGIIKDGVYKSIDSIGTTSVQSMVTEGPFAYVAYQDTIVKYNLVLEKRENQINVPQSGFYSTTLALSDDYLVIGKDNGINGKLEFRNKHTLETAFEIPKAEFSDNIDGIMCEGNYCYISHNTPRKSMSWVDSSGAVSIVDLELKKIIYKYPLGTDGAGVGRILRYKNNLYALCSGTKKLLKLSVTGPVLSEITATSIVGISGKYLYTANSVNYKVNGIDRYDLETGEFIPADDRLKKPFQGNSSLAAACVDTITSILYLSTTRYSNNDTLFTFDAGENVKLTMVGKVPEEISVLYNELPVAADDEFLVQQGETTKLNVLINDSDNDDHIKSIGIMRHPLHGSAKIVDNKIEYSSDKLYTGEDVILYYITDVWGDTAFAEVSLSVEAVTGNVVASDFNVTVYPNPVQDVLYVKNITNEVSVTISDLTGKILTAYTSGGDISFDLNGFDQGCYLLTIQNGEKKSVQKIIKK
jgi:hypothetical protein